MTYALPAPAPTRNFVPDASTAVLLDMLTYMRPGGSSTEAEWIDKFIRPFDPLEDGYGNLYVQVGENPEILWSSHTDTVHHKEGRQTIQINGNFVTAVTGKKRKGTNCLGADDTAGVWLMLEMIKAQVPGLYIFHRDEETGGRGSSYIAKNHTQVIERCKFAIALDRKGYKDVITHQGWQRCCSDDFANSLAAAIGMEFRPDDGGIFTDTANYTDLIGECTNLSIGYFNQHGPLESLDLDFVTKLRDALISADFTSLKAVRQPGEEDPDYYMGFSAWNDEPKYKYSTRQRSALEKFVYNNPEFVSDWLELSDVTVEELEREAEDLGYTVY